jgi:hypothetical protein
MDTEEDINTEASDTMSNITDTSDIAIDDIHRDQQIFTENNTNLDPLFTDLTQTIIPQVLQDYVYNHYDSTHNTCISVTAIKLQIRNLRINTFCGDNVSVDDICDMINATNMIEYIITKHYITIDYFFTIHQLLMRQKTRIEQPSCVDIKLDSQIVFCGDIHSSLSSLLFHILAPGGFSDNRKFIFLGDYLDRGSKGIECVCILLLLRFLFPGQVFVLRGNHETRNVYRRYGTTKEIQKKKPNITTSELNIFCDKLDEIINMMSFAAIIGNNIFATHGCPSEYTPIHKIRNITKKSNGGYFNSVEHILIWSDPILHTSKTSWKSPRGAGCHVPQYVTQDFMSKNGFKMIIRGHEWQKDGVSFEHPDVVTIFGRPDYRKNKKSLAAMLLVDIDGKRTFIKFSRDDALKILK